MSAFAPMNVLGANQQKKQLIQRLTEQYQQSAQRAAGIGTAAGPALAAAALPNSRPFGGAGRLTAMLPNFAQTIIDRLGPGGYGHPIVGRENSPGPGVDVGRGLATAPHSGSVLAPGGAASSPIPAGGIQAPISSPQSPVTFAPTSPSSPLSSLTATVTGPTSTPVTSAPGGNVVGAIQGPTHTIVDPGFNTVSSGPIDLGGGLYYDPSTGTVRAASPPPPQGSAVRTGSSVI